MSNITLSQIQQDPLDFARRIEAGESMMIVEGSRPLAEIKPIASIRDTQRPFASAWLPASSPCPLTLTPPCRKKSSASSRGHEAAARGGRRMVVGLRFLILATVVTAVAETTAAPPKVDHFFP